MSLESFGTLLVRAHEMFERVPVVETATILAVTKLVVGAATHRPLSRPKALRLAVDRDQTVAAKELAAAAAQAKAHQARELVAEVDDEQFTGENAAALCHCDADPECRALYFHREGVEQLAGWRDVARGLAAYNRIPKYSRKQWLAEGSPEAEAVAYYFGLLNHVALVEEFCPADRHYPQAELDVVLGKPVVTSRDAEKIIPTRERWDDLEWRRLAWPVVAFQHHYTEPGRKLRGDGDRGYRADPTAIASRERLEREYAKARIVHETDYVRPIPGYVEVEADGARREVEVTALRSGEVEREYRRRIWCESQPVSRMYLPFEEPWQFKAHSEFLRACDRRRLHERRQRQAIARLVAALGGDIHADEVVQWVRSHARVVTRDAMFLRRDPGYDDALAKLRARARREGVAQYA